MTTIFVTPVEAKRLIEAGTKLIDIRDRDEYAREHIPGADNMPMVEIDRSDVWSGPVVFHCRSGARTQACAVQLAAAAGEALDTEKLATLDRELTAVVAEKEQLEERWMEVGEQLEG